MRYAAGVSIRNRVCPARARRSRSPVTSRSAFPLSARSRNSWSFLSRQDNLDFLVTLITSQGGRYSPNNSMRSSEESWNFGYRNTRVSQNWLAKKQDWTVQIAFNRLLKTGWFVRETKKEQTNQVRPVHGQTGSDPKHLAPGLRILWSCAKT